MSRVTARLLWPTLALASFLFAASATAAAPAQLRYLDTDAANVGSFVGVYGSGFGDPTGGAKISIGSVQATDIPLWTDSVIIFRVPASATTDTVKVTPKSGTTMTSAAALKISSGQVFVVATNGSDSGLGSDAQPFRSLHRALLDVVAGDTVLVRGGTYDEIDEAAGSAPAFYIRPIQSGTLSSPITIRGFGSEVPVLSGTNASASGESILALAGSNLRLARMEINGKSNKGDAISVFGNNIWLSALELHNFGARGIFVADVSEITIVGNKIHDGGSVANDHALLLTGRNLTVRDNTISNLAHGFGILLAYQTQSQASIFSNFVRNTAGGGIGFDRVKGGNRVYNNVFENVGADAVDGCHCALQVSYGASSAEPSSGGDKIYYNTFYGPAETAVRITDRSGKVELNGNIFSSFASGLLVEDTGSTTALISSNNLWNGTSSTPKFRWGAAVYQFAEFQTQSKQEAASVLADPRFVDPKTSDFHLQGISPAIDHGGGTDSVQVDIEGNPRIVPPDMGAYEGKAVDAGVPDGSTDADTGTIDSSAGDATSDVTSDSAMDGASDSGSPAAAGDDAGGCGCSLWATQSAPSAFASFAILASLVAVRRRRRA